MFNIVVIVWIVNNRKEKKVKNPFLREATY